LITYMMKMVLQTICINFYWIFFKIYPKYNKLDFYIFGESYAGHYVPAIGSRIVDGNQKGGNLKINLKGVGIGNGWVDPAIQYGSNADLLYSYDMLPDAIAITYDDVLYPGCKLLIESELWPAAVEECNLALEAVLLAGEAYMERSINVYDVRIPCEYPPLCYDFSSVDSLLGQTAVKKALGVPPSISWTSCSTFVHLLMLDDWVGNFAVDIPKMLSQNIRVLIYSGDKDFICNYIGGKQWVLEMDWSGKGSFNQAPEQQWTVGGKPAGLYKTSQGFTFMQVFNAGHMVPMDQPANALDMVQQFITNNL